MWHDSGEPYVISGILIGNETLWREASEIFLFTTGETMWRHGRATLWRNARETVWRNVSVHPFQAVPDFGFWISS